MLGDESGKKERALGTRMFVVILEDARTSQHPRELSRRCTRTTLNDCQTVTWVVTDVIPEQAAYLRLFIPSFWVGYSPLLINNAHKDRTR